MTQEELNHLKSQLTAKDAEIDRLTKIAAGYKTLTDSLEQQRTTLREQVQEGRAAVATLASECEANAILTAECDRLRVELAQAHRLLDAVIESEYDGIRCADVGGKNWFDARAAIKGEA